VVFDEPVEIMDHRAGTFGIYTSKTAAAFSKLQVYPMSDITEDPDASPSDLSFLELGA